MAALCTARNLRRQAAPTTHLCLAWLQQPASMLTWLQQPEPHPPAGFVGATVTQDTLSLDYYTLEGGSKAAFSTTIQRPAAS